MQRFPLVAAIAHASGWRSIVLALIFLLGSCCGLAHANFTTITNAPPTVIPNSAAIGSNTQLNVFNNGTVGSTFRAGSVTSTNVEVNISGGTVGSGFQAQHNSTVNISGGAVGTNFSAGINNDANNNVHVNVSGGTLGDGLVVNRASTVTITGGAVGKTVHVLAGGILSIGGGSIGQNLTADPSSTLSVSGGTIDSGVHVGGTFNMSGGVLLNGVSGTAATLNISGGSMFGLINNGGSTANYFGSDWRLNGVPITQLQNIGDTYIPVIQPTDTLSGILSDGTPVVVSSSIPRTLTTTAVPAVGPAVLHAGIDPLGLGIRSGQTLIVDSGSTVGTNYNAGWGSAIQVHAGGSVGARLQAAGTAVTVDGGSIAGSFYAYGGANVQLTSGSIAGMLLNGTSTFNMSGGSASYTGGNGSISNLSGGAVSFNTSAGSQVNLFGGEMRLDGVPIAGLDHESDSVAINVPTGSILSGSLADGKPFMVSSLFNNFLANGTLTLHAMAPPPIAAAPIFASAGAVPYGLRSGETLIVDSGGNVPAGFRGSWDSSIEIRAGGTMGQNLLGVGTNLRVLGGSLGTSATLWGNSTARIEGGTVGATLTLHGGSVEVVGGTVAGLSVKDGATATISGGTINSLSVDSSTINISGGNFTDSFQMSGKSTANLSGAANVGIRLFDQSALNISGGTLNNSLIWDQSVVNMTGGTLYQPLFSGQGTLNMAGGALTGLVFGTGTLNVTGGNVNAADWSLDTGSKLNLYGAEMRLNGVPVAGLQNPGDAVSPNVSGGGILSGVLADGTYFLLPASGFANDGTILLHAATLPLAPTLINVPSDSAPTTIRSGQTLAVGAGGSVANNFLAGWDSTLTVRQGGSVGWMTAIGARINIEGGTIGGIEAYQGTTVTMTSGTLTDVHARNGAVVNFGGGKITGGIQSDAGGTVNFMGGAAGATSINQYVVQGIANNSGGHFAGYFEVTSGGVANISGGVSGDVFDAGSGSAVNFFGTQFRLNGAVIPGLSLGTPLVITARDKMLTGILMDGTAFSINLNSADQFNADSFSPTGTLTLFLLAPAIAGDFNNDGTVNSADYVVWRHMQNTTVARGTNGDANYDGQVTDADFMIWRAHFGPPVGSGASAAVPEPSTMLLTMVGLMSAIIRRR